MSPGFENLAMAVPGQALSTVPTSGGPRLSAGVMGLLWAHV